VLVVMLAVAALAVALAVPAIKRIVRELTYPLRDTAIINQQAAAEHLDPALVAAVIYAESKFVPRTSSAGGTSFKVTDLAHPTVNIAYGSYYLRYLLNRYDGNRTLALAAYNAGMTNVDNWVTRAHAAGDSFSVNEIPFPQTRAYVAKVEAATNTYRRYYAKLLGPP
jgi:soluble lytic murein transglycosylase